MFLSKNKFKDDGWVLKLTTQELDLLFLHIAPTDWVLINKPNPEDPTKPVQLTPEEDGKVSKLWAIFEKVRHSKPPQPVQPAQANGEDVEIECGDCCNVFMFSAGEANYYAAHGYPAPRRCKDCREVRKSERANRAQA